MEEKIIIAGFGGQGIMFMGRLICQAGMSSGFNVTFMPSYGAEVRGGTANCHVIIKDEPIGSPVIDKADTLIIFNEPSLLKYENRLGRDGVLIINSSLVKKTPKKKGIRTEKIPSTDLAYGIGNVKTANLIMLGMYVRVKNILDAEIVKDVVKGPLADLNKEAFDIGYNYTNSVVRKDETRRLE